MIPAQVRRINECSGKILCITCNIQLNENKDFEAILNELKRHQPNEFGHKHPYYKI